MTYLEGDSTDMTEEQFVKTQKNATASQDNDVLPSAGTPADAVSSPIQRLGDEIVKQDRKFGEALIKSLMPAGAFVTDDHRYYFNGEGPKPSVTTVLEILDKPALTIWKQQQIAKAMHHFALEGYFDHPDTEDFWDEERAVKESLSWVRKTRTDAASVGSGVHHLADMALRAHESDPNAWKVDEDTQPWIDAFKAFVDRYSATSFMSSEKAVWSLNGYGGTYDLLMMIDGELWLIDIKTGKRIDYDEYALQLAGYRWADYIILPGDPTTYDMPHIDRTGILHLRPDQYPEQGYRLYEVPTTYGSDYITFLGLLEAWKWKQEKRKPLPISHKD